MSPNCLRSPRSWMSPPLKCKCGWFTRQGANIFFFAFGRCYFFSQKRPRMSVLINPDHFKSRTPKLQRSKTQYLQPGSLKHERWSSSDNFVWLPCAVLKENREQLQLVMFLTTSSCAPGGWLCSWPPADGNWGPSCRSIRRILLNTHYEDRFEIIFFFIEALD